MCHVENRPIPGNPLGFHWPAWPDVFMNMATEKNMKNTKKNAKNGMIQIAGHDRNPACVDREWLTSRGRNGRRRIETLGWKRLAAIYNANKPGSAIRKAIEAEARRCGYTPKTILTINAD